MIAERRENPTDDLTSVLVHAEVDGEKLEEHEIVMGFFLLVAAGNDSTKATYCSGMRALMEDPDAAPAAARRPLADPGRGRGVAADVPRLRPLPPHRDRATPSCNGQKIKRGREGGHVVRRRRTATRRATRTPTASTSAATPSTRRSAPAAATSASAPRWPGSSCRSSSRRRSRATRRWSSTGEPDVRRVGLPQPAEDAAGAAVGALSRLRVLGRRALSAGLDFPAVCGIHGRLGARGRQGIGSHSATGRDRPRGEPSGATISKVAQELLRARRLRARQATS